MLTWLVLGGLFGGAVTALAARVFRGSKDAPPLPPAGGPPPDRAEAVRRVLKHLQRKTIAELEDGVAAVVVGTVKVVDGVAPLRAPVTGTECLGYHLDVRIAELDPWFRLPQIYEDARVVEIDVEDGTGTLRVMPDGLDLAITDGTIGRWDQLPPGLRGVVSPSLHHVPVTIEEGVFHDGARILVCGVVSRERDPTDYRDGGERLRMRASATFPLVASTDGDLIQPGERPIAPEEVRRRLPKNG